MVQQQEQKDHHDKMEKQFGQNVAKLSKKMVREDKEKHENHRAMIRAN